MTTRRLSTAENLETAREQLTSGAESESSPVAPPKANPMAQAVKLRAALDKIDKLETDAIANARGRYQAERDHLLAAAGDRVKAILRAAEEEEG